MADIGVVLGTGWSDQGAPDGVKVIPRNHLYHGFTVAEAVAPVLAAIDAGVDTIILTNACGALTPRLRVGQVVSIADHLNLTGECPDVGFLPLAGVWSCVGELDRVVYAQVRGPAFETPAEARMLRGFGADVVGMSTVIEAIAAHSAGARVVGLSLVTDHAGGTDGHQDVLAAASKVDLRSVLDLAVKELS